jgi:hypothetical protein
VTGEEEASDMMISVIHHLLLLSLKTEMLMSEMEEM